MDGGLFYPAPPRHYYDSRYGFHLEEDFILGLTGIFSPGSNANSGSQSNWQSGIPLPTGWMGATRMVVQSSASSVAALGFFTPIALGLGPTWTEARIYPEAVSDATDTYTFRFGYADVYNGDAVDGAYFRYTHGVNGGRFECVTRNNSAETAQNSGVTFAINTDYILRIEISADASSAKFYINGSLVATITTNIPSGLTRHTAYGIHMVKSVGTGAKVIAVDKIKIDYIYTTPLP